MPSRRPGPDPFLVATCLGALALSAWMLLRLGADAPPFATPTPPVAAADREHAADDTAVSDGEHGPSDVANELALGIELYDQRLFRDARAPLERALAADASKDEAGFYLGLTLMELREYQRAQELLEAAVDAEPEDAERVFALAQALGMQIEGTSNPISMMTLASRSKGLLDRAIELDGGLVDARLGRIMFFLLAPAIVGGGVDKARSEADAIATENEAVGLFAKGWLAEESGNWAEAEDLHRRAIALDPDYPRVRHRLGYLLLGQRRYEEAREQFDAYARIEPNNPFAHEGLAQCLVGLGQPDVAVESAARSVELDPRFHQGVFRLAECSAALGDEKRARDGYERFLDLAGERDSEAARVVRARAWLELHGTE